MLVYKCPKGQTLKGVIEMKVKSIMSAVAVATLIAFAVLTLGQVKKSGFATLRWQEGDCYYEKVLHSLRP